MIDLPANPDAIPPKNPAAVELGRRGGTARAARMSPEARSEQSRLASVARWAKVRADKEAAA